MSSLHSPVPEIKNLYFRKLPSNKPVAIDIAVRVDGVVLMRSKTGALYWDRREDGCYLAGEWPWMPPLLKALCRIGAITADQRDQHLTWNADAVKRKNRMWQAEAARKRMAELGIALTKRQAKLLAEAEQRKVQS